MASVIQWFFSNFFLSMVILGLLIANLHMALSPSAKLARIDTLLRHQLLFAVGVASIYGFILHSVFGTFTAHFIGWAQSPFQFEVAVANLGLGMTGLIGYFASRGYQAATITSLTCFYWGAAGGHLWQMLHAHNFAPGNTGSIFYIDLFLPILLITLYAIRAYRKPRLTLATY